MIRSQPSSASFSRETSQKALRAIAPVSEGSQIRWNGTSVYRTDSRLRTLPESKSKEAIFRNKEESFDFFCFCDEKERDSFVCWAGRGENRNTLAGFWTSDSPFGKEEALFLGALDPVGPTSGPSGDQAHWNRGRASNLGPRGKKKSTKTPVTAMTTIGQDGGRGPAKQENLKRRGGRGWGWGGAGSWETPACCRCWGSKLLEFWSLFLHRTEKHFSGALLGHYWKPVWAEISFSTRTI